MLPLADAIEPVTPPAGPLTQVEVRLFADTPSEDRPGLFGSSLLWRSFSTVAAAAALFLAVAVNMPGSNLQIGGQALIAQLQNEERALNVSAYFKPGANTLVLSRASGDPESGREFELWQIAPESAPVSLCTLPVGERIEVAVEPNLAQQLDLGAALAISDEPDGGSPTGQPTGDILAVGSVSLLQI